MAGTVVQGARVWTGPSPWQEADISPKAELFPFWLTHSHPDDIKSSLPIREYSLGRRRNILSGPANLLSSPPQLIKCPVVHQLEHGSSQGGSTKPETRPLQRAGARSMNKAKPAPSIPPRNAFCSALSSASKTK